MCMAWGLNPESPDARLGLCRWAILPAFPYLLGRRYLSNMSFWSYFIAARVRWEEVVSLACVLSVKLKEKWGIQEAEYWVRDKMGQLVHTFNMTHVHDINFFAHNFRLSTVCMCAYMCEITVSWKPEEGVIYINLLALEFQVVMSHEMWVSGEEWGPL